MPEFCRHGRFLQNCRICNKPQEKAAPRPRSGTRSPAPAGRSRGASGGRTSGVVVKRMARAVEDGYESELVPGLKASGDARRLADELAFATARLAELAVDPPGLYAEAALADDLEESLWLAFLVAHLSPLSGEADAFATIREVRRPWASGELPPVGSRILGPRTTVDPKDPARTLVAYRGWAQRHGGSQAAALSGDDNWSAERRFERVFERLSLPGFARAGRFELLVSLGRLGLVDVSPPDLQLGEAADPAVIAAKRVFGIGERFLLERRVADLAAEAGIPLDAFDLALFNFGQPQEARATMGSTAEPDAELRTRVEHALGV